jgi:hypothetical protein
MKSIHVGDLSREKKGRSLPLTILLVLTTLIVCAVAASAQTTIYCASEDGRRHRCPVDTADGVRLLEQKSSAACIQGRTWGYKRDHIWVDRGCRADFEVIERRGGRGRGDRGRGGDYYSHGSVTWVGKVDHDIKLVIYGSQLDFYVQSGKSYGPGRYSFTAPMPRDARVTVQRIRGRNDITITEQPSGYNKNSAVIRITDSRGGSDQTEVVISW